MTVTRSLCFMVLLAAAITPPLAAQTLPTSAQCRDCHLTLEDARLSTPARSYEGDVHAEKIGRAHV